MDGTGTHSSSTPRQVRGQELARQPGSWTVAQVGVGGEGLLREGVTDEGA